MCINFCLTKTKVTQKIDKIVKAIRGGRVSYHFLDRLQAKSGHAAAFGSSSRFTQNTEASPMEFPGNFG